MRSKKIPAASPRAISICSSAAPALRRRGLAGGELGSLLEQTGDSERSLSRRGTEEASEGRALADAVATAVRRVWRRTTSGAVRGGPQQFAMCHKRHDIYKRGKIKLSHLKKPLVDVNFCPLKQLNHIRSNVGKSPQNGIIQGVQDITKNLNALGELKLDGLIVSRTH